jgi:hypothetical protein
MYGWTPDQIANMTPYQTAMYYVGGDEAESDPRVRRFNSVGEANAFLAANGKGK